MPLAGGRKTPCIKPSCAQQSFYLFVPSTYPVSSHSWGAPFRGRHHAERRTRISNTIVASNICVQYRKEAEADPPRQRLSGMAKHLECSHFPMYPSVCKQINTPVNTYPKPQITIPASTPRRALACLLWMEPCGDSILQASTSL